jgi:TM2 domain-containing membrane protein YozV
METSNNLEGSPSNGKTSSKQRWSTTLVLCIFLGMFGVHRFYTGYKGIGIIQLFTGGGGIVWWLSDLLAIYKGEFKNKEGIVIKRTRWGCLQAWFLTFIGTCVCGILALSVQTSPETSNSSSSNSPQQSFSPRTYYAFNDGVRGRSCPSLNCDVVATLSRASEFVATGSTSGDTVSGSSTWYVGNRNNQTVYIHSSLLSRTQPAQNSSNTNSNANAQTIRRPANCADAVAMGLSAEQAAQWSHLDRDNDGVACYGD